MRSAQRSRDARLGCCRTVAVVAGLIGLCTQVTRAECPNGGSSSDAISNAYVSLAFDDGSGETLYVGGGFTVAGDAAARNIVRWNGTHWSAVGEGLDFTVTDLKVFQEQLLAMGFVTVDPTGFDPEDHSRLALWDGSAWTPVTLPYPGLFKASIVHNDELYALQSRYNDFTMYYLYQWNGADWTLLATDAGIFAFAEFDGKLAIGGTFTGLRPRNPDGTSEPSVPMPGMVGAWDGTTWAPLGDGVAGGYVTCLLNYNGDLIAGGTFTTAGGNPANRVARWDGNTWSAMGDGLSVAPSYLTEYNGILMAVVPTKSIALWDGSAWITVIPAYQGMQISSRLRHLSAWGTSLVAAGSFSIASDPPVRGLLVWAGSDWSPLARPPAEVLLTWSSLREHTGYSDYAILLDGTDGAVTTEPRIGGIRKIVVEFSEPVRTVDDPGDVVDDEVSVTGMTHGVQVPTSMSLIDGMTKLVMEFADGLPHGDRYTIAIEPCAMMTVNGGYALEGDLDVEIRALEGDASSDGVVNIVDLSDVKQHLFAAVDASTAPFDVNTDGVINIVDLNEVKQRLFTTAP